MKVVRLSIAVGLVLSSLLILTSCGLLSSSNAPLPEIVWSDLGNVTDGRINGMTWFSAGYVAVSSNGAVLISEDGSEWEERTRDRLSPLNDIEFSGGRYVAVGPFMYTATNVRTWVRSQATITHNLNAVVWSGSMFVAVGDNGKIIYSPDGLVWSPANSPVNVVLHDVAHRGSRFIAVGDDGAILFSTDGVNWSTPQAPSAGLPDLYGATIGANGYVAVGANGTVMQSPEGLNWSSASSGTSEWLVDVGSTDAGFVAVGLSGTVVVRSNGMGWSRQLVQTDVDLWAVSTTNPLLLLAAGEDGTLIFRSTSAVN